MDPIFIQVDVHFQGILSKYPIRYTRGITQRFSNINFAGMDKNGCYEFTERFTGEKCEELYYYQPDIDFPKGLIKEFETWALDGDEDEDEDDPGDEDVDVDDDEDDLSNLHIFKKNNGPDIDMDEDTCLGKPLEEAIDDNEDVYHDLPNIFNDNPHWKE
ncbi:unnamed protein product [Lactuca saligna]|uniref:Uncharacterized protein n=1 Tax=Lactuca saligna TaxID=75948 RepID=A0AA35VLL6_LACSI|nr:unnamed protein product [Lactuca saligna]